MSNYICFFLILFTSIIGTIEIVKMAVELLFNKKLSNNAISILPIKDCSDQLEYIIRGALLKTDGKLIVVDMGVSDNDYTILDRLKNECSRIFIVKKDELYQYICE